MIDTIILYDPYRLYDIALNLLLLRNWNKTENLEILYWWKKESLKKMHFDSLKNHTGFCINTKIFIRDSITWYAWIISQVILSTCPEKVKTTKFCHFRPFFIQKLSWSFLPICFFYHCMILRVNHLRHDYWESYVIPCVW